MSGKIKNCRDFFVFYIMVAVYAVDNVTPTTTTTTTTHTKRTDSLLMEESTTESVTWNSSLPDIKDDWYVDNEPEVELVNTSLEIIDWPLYWKSISNYTSLPDNDKTKDFILKYSGAFHRQLIATQLSYCPTEPLCSHTLNVHVTEDPPNHASCCLSCSCMQNCTEYGNCCLDKVIDTLGTSADMTAKVCIPLHIYTDNTPWVYGIAHCPVATTYFEREKCEHSYEHNGISMIDIVPVMHPGSNTVFRNKHCALCNDVALKELEFFTAKLGCYGNIPSDVQTDYELIQLVLTNKCDMFFHTNHKTENCTHSISTCNVTKQWTTYDPDIEIACSMYSSPFQVGPVKIFKNVFCAICNGYMDIARSCQWPEPPDSISQPFSFSGLLAFASDKDDAVTKTTCKAGFIYNKTMDECIQVRCSPLGRLSGNKCVPIMKYVETFNYNVVLSLTLSQTHTMAEVSLMAEDLLAEVKHFMQMFVEDSSYMQICSVNGMMKSVTPCSLGTVQTFLQRKLGYFLLKMDFRITHTHYPEDIIFNLSNMIVLDINNVTGIDNETMVIRVINGFEEDFERSFRSPFVGSYAHPENICSGLDDTILVPFVFNSSEERPCVPYISAQHQPVTSLLTCPMVQVSNDSYKWVITENGVLFSRSGHIFNHSRFYKAPYDDAVLFLCIEQFFELSKPSVVKRWTLTMEQIVSIVCVSLSILSLFITLTVMCFLAPLRRNLPGKNNMALVSALLIAQILYLVSSFSGLEEGSVFCKALGILTHFSWLLVVFWMNVCTFHMYHVLTKTKAISRHSGNKRYLAYHLYCIVCSGMFVGINIIVIYITSDFTNIGYGANSCYISSQYMLMYTFAIPLALTLVSNIIMFLIVIQSIKRASAVQKNVQNERNDIAVFARLSTLTGATWIFGLIYTWTRVTALSYVFIVLNAGQGVFLFLSFICTRRVFRMASQAYTSSSTSATSGLKQTLSTDVSRK